MTLMVARCHDGVHHPLQLDAAVLRSLPVAVRLPCSSYHCCANMGEETAVQSVVVRTALSLWEKYGTRSHWRRTLGGTVTTAAGLSGGWRV